MLSSLTLAGSPLSCDTTVFGFEKYVKTTRQTNDFTDNFAVSNPANNFVIVVFNGLHDEDRISRGTIHINGLEVVSSSDFSQNVDAFEKPVGSLQASNTIDVSLQRGAVGEFIVVRVVDRGSGFTSLSGRVLSTTDKALEKVRLTIGRMSVLTDRNGDFLLQDLPCGKQRLAIDASGVKGKNKYASVNELLDLAGGVLNQITRPIYLPEIDLSNGVEVPAQVTSDITITNPGLPGVSLTIKAGTEVTYPDGSASAVVTVTEVPVGKTPMSLPPELAPAAVITVQPEGVVLSQAATVVYPNLENLPPGEKVDLISLSPGSGQFVGQGTATVSADGASLVADEFSGLFSFDWHTWLPFPPDPSDPNPDRQDCNCRGGVGSEAGLFDGGLIDREDLPAYHSVGAVRGVTLHYNSLVAHPMPILASHTTINAVSATPELLSYLLEVAGVPQGAETYVDTSTLDTEVDEETWQAVQFQGSGLATASYPYDIHLTADFLITSASVSLLGDVIVNNQSSSPFGAGWGIGGLQRLYPQPGGDALITHGDGSAFLFRSFPSGPVIDFAGSTGEPLGAVAVSLGTEAAGFQPPVLYAASPDGEGLEAADVNGDSITDLITLGRSGPPGSPGRVSGAAGTG